MDLALTGAIIFISVFKQSGELVEDVVKQQSKKFQLGFSNGNFEVFWEGWRKRDMIMRNLRFEGL